MRKSYPINPVIILCSYCLVELEYQHPLLAKYVTACGFEVGEQNNWLIITQSRRVNGTLLPQVSIQVLFDRAVHTSPVPQSAVLTVARIDVWAHGVSLCTRITTELLMKKVNPAQVGKGPTYCLDNAHSTGPYLEHFAWGRCRRRVHAPSS